MNTPEKPNFKQFISDFFHKRNEGLSNNLRKISALEDRSLEKDLLEEFWNIYVSPLQEEFQKTKDEHFKSLVFISDLGLEKGNLQEENRLLREDLKADTNLKVKELQEENERLKNRAKKAEASSEQYKENWINAINALGKRLEEIKELKQQLSQSSSVERVKEGGFYPTTESESKLHEMINYRRSKSKHNNDLGEGKSSYALAWRQCFEWTQEHFNISRKQSPVYSSRKESDEFKDSKEKK